jgi:hypothetical protein
MRTVDRWITPPLSVLTSFAIFGTAPTFGREVR